MILLLLLVLGGCGRQDANERSIGAERATTPALAQDAAGASERLTGLHTFTIVPEQSKASYLANEEFFAGALNKLGIAAGMAKAVGSTKAIEGQFQLDPDNVTAALGTNTFTVRMNTFTTNQRMRDQWIREDGPHFNDYPLAIFKATAIESATTAFRAGGEVNFKLAGSMTIRNITKPVTFDVRSRLAGDTLTGVATTRLLMSRFGIEQLTFANTLTVADEFGIEVQFTARAQTK